MHLHLTHLHRMALRPAERDSVRVSATCRRRLSPSPSLIEPLSRAKQRKGVGAPDRGIPRISISMSISIPKIDIDTAIGTAIGLLADRPIASAVSNRFASSHSGEALLYCSCNLYIGCSTYCCATKMLLDPTTNVAQQTSCSDPGLLCYRLLNIISFRHHLRQSDRGSLYRYRARPLALSQVAGGRPRYRYRFVVDIDIAHPHRFAENRGHVTRHAAMLHVLARAAHDTEPAGCGRAHVRHCR